MPGTVVGVKDARLNANYDVIQAVELGPTSSTYQLVAASDPTNINSVSFTVQPSTKTQGIGRFVRLQMVGTAVFTFSAAPTADNTQICFRQWPLNSIISTSSCQINNTALTLSNVNTIAPVISRIANSFKNMNSYQSSTCTMPDILTNYAAANATLMNPFAPGYTYPLGDVNLSRLAHITSTGIIGNVLTLSFEIDEPIMNPLFQCDKEETGALYGVSVLNVTLNYTNVFRMFSSIATGLNLVTCVVRPTKQNLLINYVTPQDIIYKQLPTYYSVPNIRLDQASYNCDVAAGAADSTITAMSSTIQLQKVPRYLVIWVSPSTPVVSQAPSATPVYSTSGAQGIADLMFPIQSVIISAFDKSGLLSGASQAQLYSLSCCGGLTNTTFSQFAGEAVYTNAATPVTYAADQTRFNGAPLVIPFSDLSLPLGVAPDSDLSSTFSAQVTFKYNGGVLGADNTTANLPGYIINVMTIIDGILELNDGASNYIYGGLSREQVMSAVEASPDQILTIDKIRDNSMIMGASFWSKIKDAYNWVKDKAAPVAKEIYQVAKPLVHSGLQALGPEGMAAEQALTKIGGARARLARRHY